MLPFQNMSGDPEQEYFADGMVEDIITALSRFKSLFVIARNSSFTYKGQAVDVRQVGRELGVRYVLEGSVRKAGNRVRITGQLIDATTARHLWADRFDGALEDVFDLQDRVTASVVGAIDPREQGGDRARHAQAGRESRCLRFICAAGALLWTASARKVVEALRFVSSRYRPRSRLCRPLDALIAVSTLAYGSGCLAGQRRTPRCGSLARRLAIALDSNDAESLLCR